MNDSVIERSFDCTPGAPRAARRFVCEELAERRWSGDAGDVALLVSELVTNAYRHATCDRTLVRLEFGEALRVSVTDPAADAIELVPAAPDPERLGGAGLHIMASVADDWGVEQHGDEKTVWFEMRSHDRGMRAMQRQRSPRVSDPS